MTHAWSWTITGIVCRLKALIAEGKTGGQIAKTLNHEFKTDFSRSAIIGKVHRMKLDRPVSEPKVRAETARALFLVAQRKEKAKAPPPPPKPVFDPREIFIDKGQGRATSTRKSGECAWPLGEDQSCCRPITRGSYCAFHASIAYQAVSEKKLMHHLRRELS